MNYKFVFFNDDAFLGLMDADHQADANNFEYYVFDDFWDAYTFFHKNEHLFFETKKLY